MARIFAAARAQVLALRAGRSNTAAAPAKAKARIVRRILAISRSGPAGARRRQQRHSVIAIREQSSPFASTEGRTLRLGQGKMNAACAERLHTQAAADGRERGRCTSHFERRAVRGSPAASLSTHTCVPIRLPTGRKTERNADEFAHTVRAAGTRRPPAGRRGCQVFDPSAPLSVLYRTCMREEEANIARGPELDDQIVIKRKTGEIGVVPKFCLDCIFLFLQEQIKYIIIS